MPDIPVAVTVIVQPSQTLIVEIGSQPAVRKYATVADMLAVRGSSGDLAYCYNMPDQFWKWNTGQQMWVQIGI